MSWLIFILLAINLWSISNIIDKNVVSKRIKNSILPVIITSFGSLFYAILIFLIFKLHFSIEGFILGIFWVTILLLYFKSMQLEEASRVAAFFSIIPIFVAILAYFFLGEKFSLEKYIGIILIVIGAILISIKRGSKLTLSKALYWMLLFAVVYAIYSVLLKHYVDIKGFITIFASMQLGVGISGVALFPLHKNKMRTLKLKPIILLLISQVSALIALFSFIYAVSLGPISLISAIENTQPMFVLLYATILTIFKPHIIKEDISKSSLLTKIFAIIVMVIGAYLVSV